MTNIENKNYWNKWGSKYSTVWQNKAKQKLSYKETSLIERYLDSQKSRRILDIGVGNGRILESIIVNSRKKPEIFGVDISGNMVNICRKKFKGEIAISILFL